ncbi:MAG: aminodeoxychorismate/anthranilate synthase component II [archaeon]
MKILVLDNYDSFVYNLVQYLGECGAEPVVYRNDKVSLSEIEELNPTGIVISPGPGSVENPRDFGVCGDVIKKIKKPILGVCLGHQGIVHAFGGKIVLSKEVMHGKESVIEHDRRGIFKGVKNPLEVMRYHSLIASEENFPKELKITARTKEKEVFAVQHRKLPIYGVQFHPESIGTEEGMEIVKNFVEACND